MREMIPKRIGKIDFALMGPKEVRKLSATKVITADTYDDDGFPIPMGLMDLHMGVIEPGLRCKTSGRKMDEDPGHFGHIDLAMPVIHAGYSKTVKDLMNATHPSSGRIMLTQDRIDHYNKQIQALIDSDAGTTVTIGGITRRAIREAAKAKTCPHCGEPKIKVMLDKPTTFREEGRKLTPKEVRSRLEKIPDSDLLCLGFNPKITRPEYMVLTVLSVPPVPMRPSITLESAETSEEDLTHVWSV